MNMTLPHWNRSAVRLLSTGLFVALAYSAMPTVEAAPMGGGAGHHHGGGMGGSMMGGGMLGGVHGERLLDAVNATPEQRTQIKQIMDNARNEMKAQREAGRALHDQMRQLFTQPTVDARAAETLRQQSLVQHDQASRRMMQTMLEVSRVLTPEQRSKLSEMAGQRRANMERRGPPPK